MADTDDLGVPIKKKENAAQVDDLGVPIKKKSTTAPTSKVSSPVSKTIPSTSTSAPTDGTSKSENGRSESPSDFNELKDFSNNQAPLKGVQKSEYDFMFPSRFSEDPKVNKKDEFLSNEIDPEKKQILDVLNKVTTKGHILAAPDLQSQENRQQLEDITSKALQMPKQVREKAIQDQKIQDEYNAGITKSSVKTQIGQLTAKYEAAPVGKERDVLKGQIDKLSDALNGITSVERNDADNVLSGFSKDITDKYHDKILKYYSDMKVKNPHGFENAVTKVERGTFTQDDQYSALNNILTHDANVSANDLSIMTDRGYDDLFKETMQLKAGYDQAAREVYSLPDDDPNKAEGVAHLEQMKSHLDALVSEHGDKIQAFGSTIQNLNGTYQENTNLVKNYFPEIKKKQEQDANDQMKIQLERKINPTGMMELEAVKKSWNAALGFTQSIIATGKMLYDVTLGNVNGDINVDDATDDLYRGVTGFIDNFKATTDTRPIFEKDKDGKSVTNYDQIIPSLAETATSMCIMLAGGAASSELVATKTPELANKIGLFASSFMSSVDGYVKMANQNGLVGADAYKYATTAAGLNSALFMFDIFPKDMLGVQWNTAEGKVLGDAVGNIMDGKGADAMKLVKDVAGANVIGQMQNLSDGLVGFVANNKFNLEGDNKFKTVPDWDEMKNTALMMTAISMISHGGTNLKGGKDIYNNALVTLSKDVAKTESFLVESVKNGSLSQERSQYILDLAKGTEQGVKKLPPDMTDYKKSVVLPLLSEKEKLIEENKNLDPVFQEKNNAKIEDIDNQIKDIAGLPKKSTVEPETKTDEKVKEEKGGEETSPKEEGVLTPEELSTLSTDEQDHYHAAVELGETDTIKELSDKAKQLKTENDAKETGTETKKGGEEKAPVEGEVERLRVRDDEKNGVDTGEAHNENTKETPEQVRGEKLKSERLYNKNKELLSDIPASSREELKNRFENISDISYSEQKGNWVDQDGKEVKDMSPEAERVFDALNVLTGGKDLLKIIKEVGSGKESIQKLLSGQKQIENEPTKKEDVREVDTPLPEAKDEKTSVEKIRAKQGAAKKRASAVINKIKELNKGKRFEGDQDVVSLGPDSDKLFGALEKLTHKFIDAGADVAVAISRAHEALKKTKLYQSAINDPEKTKEFQERVNQMVNESGKKKKKLTPAQRVVKKEKKSRKEKKEEIKNSRRELKSIIANVLSDSRTSPEVKKILEDKGVTYGRFTNKESKAIADNIILTQGLQVAEAIADAQGNGVKDAVRTQLYSGIINTFYDLEKNAKTEEEKQHYAENQGAVLEKLDDFARDRGQGVQAVAHFYKISPLGIVAREKQRIRTINEKDFDKGNRQDKIIEAKIEFKKIEDDASKLSDEEIKKRVEAGVVEELEKYGKKMYGQETFKKIDDALANFQQKLKGMAFESTLGIPVAVADASVSVIRKSLHAGFLLADAIKRGIDHIKENYKEEFDEKKYSDLAEEAFKDVKVKRGKKFSADTEEYIKSEKLKVLNKIFPKKALEKSKKREEVHEKIVKSMDAGALDNEEFKKLFYEKFGLVDTSSPEVDKKLKEFAEDIHKAPEGSFLRNAEYTKMLNYMGNLKKESLVKLGLPVFYANILSSYETHIRNMQFNLPVVWVDKMGLMAEKRLMGKGGINPIEYYQLLMKGYQRGKFEASAVVKGEQSAYDKAEMANILDRVEKKGIAALFKYHVYPGRLLRAADVLNVVPLSEIKQYELVRNEAEKNNNSLPEPDRKSQHQIDVEVNEIMGYTSDRLALADDQAHKDIEKIYGDKFDLKDKKQFRDFKRRSFEIMEQSRPQEIVQEGINWAKKSLLTNKPEGTLGLVSDLLTELNKRSLFPQLFIPFVNVPLNIANRMIYNTPYGAIKAFYGEKFGEGAKFGYGENKRARFMTDDEKTEVYMKSINWTTQISGLIALGLINHKDKDGKKVPALEVTGNMTGDFSKNQDIFKATGKEPYSIYVNGEKIFTYQYTPWAPIFAPVGYYTDIQKYEGSSGMSKDIASTAVKYFQYISDQSSMKGVNEFMSLFKTDPRQKFDLVNYTSQFLAKTGSSLLNPNLIKAANNDIRGLMNLDDKRAIENWQYLVKDLPFVEEILHSKYDHLGRPVKDQFSIPALDIPGYDMIKNSNDPYYKSFVDHNYYPNYFMDRNYVDLKFDKDGNVDKENSQEITMGKSTLDDVNRVRGEYVAKILEDKSTFNALNEMDNEEYKKTMQKYFSEGTNYAKLKVLLGMTDKEIEDGNDNEEITSKSKYKKMLEDK